jgi:hypothetical protein
MRPTVGEILQHIYDSEIHFSIGWMWDGGVDYMIAKDLSYLHDGKVESTGLDNVEMAIHKIAEEVAVAYPESTFAKWWVACATA